MDSCLNIKALQEALIDNLNNSGLTIGAALFVLKDVYNTLYLNFLEELENEKKGLNNKTCNKTIDIPMMEIKEDENNGEQNND